MYKTIYTPKTNINQATFLAKLGSDELFRNNYSRENSAPINVGDEHEVKIEDVGRDGDGIARIEGFVVFVTGAKLGDEVKIKINSTRRNFAFAEIVE